MNKIILLIGLLSISNLRSESKAFYYTIFMNYDERLPSFYCSEDSFELNLIKKVNSRHLLLIHKSISVLSNSFRLPNYYKNIIGTEDFFLQGYNSVERLLKDNDWREIDSLENGAWVGGRIKGNKLEYKFIVDIYEFYHTKSTVFYPNNTLAAIEFSVDDGLRDIILPQNRSSS